MKLMMYHVYYYAENKLLTALFKTKDATEMFAEICKQQNITAKINAFKWECVIEE